MQEGGGLVGPEFLGHPSTPTPTPHMLTRAPSAKLAAQPHQRRDGLVSQVVAGGRVILNHLPILFVEPPANAVDLPGAQGTWRAAGDPWGRHCVHTHQMWA